MALKLYTAPSVEPVSLVEAKLHCRIDITDDDALVTALITAARQYVEETTGRALVSQTWDYILPQFPGRNRIVLPRPPLVSITSVVYRLWSDGSSVTWSSSNYAADTASDPGAVVLVPTSTWPGDALYPVNGVTVRYSAGYGATGASVPQAIRQAILLMIGSWYENREAIITSGAMPKEIPLGVDMLLWPYRIVAI